MADGKRDNTAVNELLELAHQRPIETDDSLFAAPQRPALPPPFRPRATGAMPPPLPRHRAPAATRTDLTAAAPPSRPMSVPPPVPTNAPPSPRTVSEHDAPTRPFDRIDVDDLALEAEERVAAPPAPPAVAVTVAPLRAASAAPIDRTPSVEAAFWAGAASVDVDFGGEEAAPVRARHRRYVPVADEATEIAQHPRRARARGRTWPWIAAAFALGLGVTAIVAWPRGEGAPTPTATASSAVAPSAAVVAPAVVAPAVVEPAVIEPAVVEPAVVEPAVVTPAVVEPAVAEPAIAEPAVAEPAVAEPVVVEAPRAAVDRSRRSRHARVERKPAPRVAATAAAPAGAAVLMLGSKPPCEIWIDGKRTGLTTPQRAIRVTAGAHRIRLVNRQHKIDESFSVSARPGTPVKAIKDFSAKIRR